MDMCIVIPALNEEASIGSTIDRTLSAKEAILSNTGVSDVSIVVVSDGSTDGTVQIARRKEPDIVVLEFVQNRGYGAAIKAGWDTGEADLLAFLDADGTCDPLFFQDLIARLEASVADIAVGGRLGPESKMPLVRRVGNRLFAWLLAALATRRVTDTASGMRVVRRTALPNLLPLPDGLHFTPAMTAIALLSDQLRLVEVPMPYHEREGQSKLSVGKDGVRFLKVILQSAFLYRPARFLAPPAILLSVVAFACGIGPTLSYLRYRTVSTSAVPLLLLTTLSLTAGALLASAAYLCERLVIALLPLRRRRAILPKLMEFVSSQWFWTVPTLFLMAGVVLLARAWTTPTTRMADILAAVVCLVLGMVLGITRILNQYIAVIQNRVRQPLVKEIARDTIR